MKAQKPTGCDNAHLMDLLLADSEFIAEELGKVDQPLHWLDVAVLTVIGIDHQPFGRNR